MAVDSFNGRTGPVVSAGSDYGWSVSGSGTNFALSGNVGIGTTSPRSYAKVEVTTSGSTGVLFGDDGGSLGGVLLGYSGNSIQGRSGSDLSGNGALLINPYGGNVGVGTTSPAHKLDVSGNIGVSTSGYYHFGSTDGSSGYGLRSNSGAIQYKNSGNSAWTNIQPFLDVTLLGADPTGSADSTSAFNTALSVSGYVFIPAGTYRLTSSVTFTADNIRLAGAGRNLTKLRFDSGTTASIVGTGRADIIMEDLTIDKNSTTQAAAVFSDCTRVHVRRCGFLSGTESLFGFQQGSGSGCVGCTLTDSYFNTAGGHGVNVSHGENTIVSRNVMDAIAWAGVNAAGTNGCVIVENAITGNSSTGDQYGGIRITDISRRCIATGNRIRNTRTGIMLLGAVDSTVTANTIENTTYRGMWIAGTSGAGTPTSYNSIVGNNIYNAWASASDSDRYGIWLTKQSGGDCQGNTIIGNTVRDDRGSPNTTNAIIDSTGSPNTIANNTSNLPNPNG